MKKKGKKEDVEFQYPRQRNSQGKFVVNNRVQQRSASTKRTMDQNLLASRTISEITELVSKYGNMKMNDAASLLESPNLTVFDEIIIKALINDSNNGELRNLIALLNRIAPPTMKLEFGSGELIASIFSRATMQHHRKALARSNITQEDIDRVYESQYEKDIKKNEPENRRNEKQ